jgi:hypothetical protein
MPPPERALLSLKSLLILCSLLSLFLWANTRDRPYRRGACYFSTTTQFVLKSNRGFPWTYTTVVSEMWGDGTDYMVFNAGRGRRLTAPVPGVRTKAILLNAVFALAVSVSLSLASERYVFGRMRRGRLLPGRDRPPDEKRIS